jgi:hypothetical protein
MYIEGFNIIFIIGLSYFIYKQIDFIHLDCPEPNKRVCVANNNSINDIKDCPKGPFQCGDEFISDYSCGNNCKNNILNNFILTPPPPPPPPVSSCATFNASDCPENMVLVDNASQVPCFDINCSYTDCCKLPEDKSENVLNIKQLINDTFNDLIKDDENRISTLETRINNLSPGEGIPGPPGPSGPPGPPGTPGSDTRPDIPSSNQYSNILCPNEPGGVCKDGVTRCNDDGFCEGFALISLKDKIDLKLKYKDLNSNSYKANNLMNNLETFLLNSLK